MTANAISAEGIASIPRNWSGSIAAKGVVVLGGAGLWADVDNEAIDPAGTLRTFENRTLANITIATSEDFGGGVIRAAESLKACVTAGSFRTINPRMPDFYGGEVDQVVLYNPGASAIQVTVSAEQRFRSSAVNRQGEGSHPGHGALTVPLGSIDPAAFSASTAPLVVRVGDGRLMRVARVSAFSAVPIIVTGGEARLDAKNKEGATMLTGKVNLETLVAATLTNGTLVGTPATLRSWSYVDLILELTAYAGTAGDITLEVEYTL